MDPKLAIVVLNWNTSDLLPKALQSIVDTTQKVSYSVTVIDNASTDGGLEHVPDSLRSDERLTFIQNEENVGWITINRLWTETTAPYIVTVDPDAILHDGALDELYAFMEKHPEAGAATAALYNEDGTPQLYYRRIMTPGYFFFTTLIGRLMDKHLFKLKYWHKYRYTNVDSSIITEIEQPAWPCLIWRREALGDTIVEPRLPFYFLDVEMSTRVYKNGYKIFMVPEAKATHLKSTSYGKRSDAWRRKEYARSLRIYFWKHHPIAAPFIEIQFIIDQGLRTLVRTITGREPLR